MEALLPHLFRTEYGKLAAVLCRRFGLAHLELAEDLAADTFLLAAETWGQQGLPENPTAWLYAVAKNKAKNHLKRAGLFEEKVQTAYRQEHPSATLPEDLTAQHVLDSQLQMLFAVCHPALAQEAQIGLALRILCGFGIEEIAAAFLTPKDTINKRLYRAKETLRSARVEFTMPADTQLEQRLPPMLRTLYLLFNEGYFSAAQDTTLRKDLCLEAMRLTQLLTAYAPTCRPEVNALLALMCFQASRFEARLSATGEAILYEDQDPALWNQELIWQGNRLLVAAASGAALSKYHLEAAIAYWHTQPPASAEKWPHILQLYNQLLVLEYSPMAALNRTYALSRVQGKAAALAEAEKLALSGHPLYHSLLAELATGLDNAKARHHLQQAIMLSKSAAEKAVLEKKLAALGA